jgi:EVE domain
MAHFLFNVSGEQQASALLEAKMWGVRQNEPHRDELAPGDLVLIYLAPPKARFIGCAEVASAVHDRTPSETEDYPGDPASGVVLAHVEEWHPAVPMDAVVQRVDPTASNPLVQANAAAGFPLGLVRISALEYEAALALSREAQET